MPFKVRIHRSFFQLFIVMALVVAFQGRGPEGVAQFATSFTLLFATVLLHELSHAVVARSLGVSVRDIVVHPLGGMTRLDWTAREPRKEALISCAGPAVNLAVAAVLWIAFRGDLDQPGRLGAWILLPLIVSNLALGGLNLVPAFPMDGGRILRALLSLRLGHVPATRVAARIGRWIAALTLLVPFLAPSLGWSFFQALAFPIVGVFVFVLGEIELKQAEMGELMGRMGAEGPSGPRGNVIDVEATSRVVDEE